jgi:hypothetical protein
MRKFRIDRHRSFKNSNRQGTASLELTLFMPTYAAMLMVLFTIFSFARTRGEVAIETRHEAWMNRAQSGNQTESLEVSTADTEEVGRILNHEQAPTLGLVTATRQKNAKIYLKTLNLFTDIQLDHAVMTDCWDYKTVPFEDQENHPRLNLAERTLVFGSVDRGAFGILPSAASGFGGQAGSLQQSLVQGRNQAMSRINQAKVKVTRAISATKKKLKNLNAELEQHMNITPPDQVVIADLKKKVADASKEIAKLNHELSNLNDSVAHLASFLSDSAEAGE